MKRTLALILAVVLVLALASCAAPAAQQTEKPAEATTAQTTETPRCRFRRRQNHHFLHERDPDRSVLRCPAPGHAELRG